MTSTERVVDVIVLTALEIEYEAVLAVGAGAADVRWTPMEVRGLPVAIRSFIGRDGRPLRIAVALAPDMGMPATLVTLIPLMEDLVPRCIAMCGVCAGRPDKTKLGDVVVAERIYTHDAGKRTPTGTDQDLTTYSLRRDWKVALDRFDPVQHFSDQPWWLGRPIPYEWQECWVLAKLNEKVDPRVHRDFKANCPQWIQVIKELWRSGDVVNGSLEPTAQGYDRIHRMLILHPTFPDLSPHGTAMPFEVHVAPMGSGNQVIEDDRVWAFISKAMRTTRGVDMEAAALGILAEARKHYAAVDALVIKGVMDLANDGRSDHFKHYAARASAECLIAFLREQLPEPNESVLSIAGTQGMVEADPQPRCNEHAEATASSAHSSVIFIHWEPEGYERSAETRSQELIPELVAAALTHNEIFTKDTDLILNKRIKNTLSNPRTFEVFRQFVKMGLLKVLLRPVTSAANTGLSDESNPIALRALQIRTLRAERFEPDDKDRDFYTRLDRLLCDTPGSRRLVHPYPSVNPFALWLAHILERRFLINLDGMPNFSGVGTAIAELFIQFCREPGSWYERYRRQDPGILLPGDEDGKFFRSQAYRSLRLEGDGDDLGMKNLLQSVFNACYCYWEESAGTFAADQLMEPPTLHQGSRRYRNDTLALSAVAKTDVLISADLAELICQIRESRSRSFEHLQQGLYRMRHGSVAESDIRDRVLAVAEEFTMGAHKLRLVPQMPRSESWAADWTIVASSLGQARAVSLQRRRDAIDRIITMAVPGRVAVESIQRRQAPNELVDALVFRASAFDVPDEVASLRSATAMISPA